MRLRINGPVPGRKQKPNPETITGYPQIGTFAGMGQITVARELRMAASKCGVKCGGRNKVKKNLPKSHLCHRTNPTRDLRMGLLRQAVERAKRYSFRLDELRIYAKDHVIELYNVSVEQFIRQDLLFKLYADSMEYMKKHHSPDYWKQASNELARGRTWYNLIHLD